MAVAPEHSPTLLSGDDNTPPTPSDVSSEYDGLTAAEVLSKLEKVWSVYMCSVVVHDHTILQCICEIYKVICLHSTVYVMCVRVCVCIVALSMSCQKQVKNGYVNSLIFNKANV